MKFSFVLLALVVLCPSVSPADNPVWDGYWWATNNQSFKLGWVSGYARAMESANTIHLVSCAGNVPVHAESFSGDAKEVFKKLCTDNRQLDYAGITMGQFVDGMDVFYRDNRNMQLEATVAIAYVRDELKGKSAQDLETEVTLWRRCAAANKTGDAEQIQKACSPEGAPASAKPK